MYVRRQVYGLLKHYLSRYLLAVTVDDPAWRPEAAKDAASGSTAADGDGDDSDSADESEGDDAGGAEKGGAAGTKHVTEENGGGKGKAAVAAAATKPDPSAPKCVQLKMKPDWRKSGSKRRRGDLADGTGGGGRWAWPADRPEFCRFVLYKENSDTVSGRGNCWTGLL